MPESRPAPAQRRRPRLGRALLRLALAGTGRSAPRRSLQKPAPARRWFAHKSRTWLRGRWAPEREGLGRLKRQENLPRTYFSLVVYRSVPASILATPARITKTFALT